MSNHRITHIAAVALAIAATAAPAAAAMPADGPVDWRLPHDFQTADGRSANAGRSQDLRNPDTVDHANGRGTYNAPEVVVLEAPEPVAAPSAGGVEWEDVGLGAGGLVGIALVSLGGALAVAHRRGRRLAS